MYLTLCCGLSCECTSSWSTGRDKIAFRLAVVRLTIYLFFGQQAFFQGKLKITGNMGMAMKLQNLQLQPGKAKL